MTGRFHNQVDESLSWAASRCALPQKEDAVNNIPSQGGNISCYTQPQFSLGPEPRGFGLKTGIPRAPEILIDDFNKETQTIQSNLMTFYPAMQRDDPMEGMVSPSLTLTKDDLELGDLLFGGTFDDDATASPIMVNSPFSRTELGIPSSQPLSRNNSQASSRLQDDAISLAFSTASAGDDLGLPLGVNYFTPGTSFSQEQLQMSATMSLPGTSPATSYPWPQAGQGPNPSSSPRLDLSFDFDSSFSTMGSDLSDIPRSVPRRMPQQSALSQSLANSPIPKLPDPDTQPDPYFELMASGEEALSADFARLDGQEAVTGLIPYQLDGGFSHINVTPADPLDPLAMEDIYGTSPGGFHPHDYVPFSPHMSHSFPEPQGQIKDDRLTVPDRSFTSHRRPFRRPRALSGGGSRPPSITSGHRTNASSKPIPIPGQQRHVKSSMPRSLPGSLPHGSRGRRKGPMEETARQLAKKTRNEKTICIRCKGSKQRCHRPEDQSDGRCANCEKIANTPKLTGPCTKAYFDDLVLMGSLDGKYLLEMTHQTRDSRRRACKTLPSEFSIETFVRQLDYVRSRFDLKICDGGRQLYVLDLESFFRYMKMVKDSLLSKEESESDFVAFIDKDLVNADPKTDDWMSVLTDASSDPRENIIDFYLDIARMPEHVTLFYVSKDPRAADERLINPEAPIEEAFLVLAARLVRIINRKVEVSAFVQLQKEMHDVLLNPGSQHQKSQFVTFLHRLGRILVTLRARVARASAAALAAGGPQPPPNSPNEPRALELCRVLYFYYYVFRRRLPGVIGEPWDGLLKGMWMPPAPPGVDAAPSLASSFNYSPTPFTFQAPGLRNDAGEVWNMFPAADGENIPGFDAWMAAAPEAHSNVFMA